MPHIYFWELLVYTVQSIINVFVFDLQFRSRLATRIGGQHSLAAAFLLIMLPGTISLFYGDEIGLEDSYDLVMRKVSQSHAISSVAQCCSMWF